MKNILKALSILLVCSLLAACGGGSGGGGSNGSNGSSSTPAPDENANGIWSGTSSVNGLVSETLGLFNDGDFVAINFDFDDEIIIFEE